MKFVMICSLVLLNVFFSVRAIGSDIKSPLQKNVDPSLFKEVKVERIDDSLSGDTITLKRFQEECLFVYISPMMCGSCIEKVLLLMDSLEIEFKVVLLFDSFILRNISLFNIESFDSYVVHDSNIDISCFYHPFIFILDDYLRIKRSFSYTKSSDKRFLDFLKYEF